MRIGLGYDSHRFAAGRRLVLGGVEIPHERGLAGHSDADVVAHAIADAVLGAAGAGDIGTHFPPREERWRDADSLDLLRAVVALVRVSRWQVVNVDVSVICENPRLAPYIPAMRRRLAEVLELAPEAVSIKGKTNEGMGWIGRGEGIAVIAVAQLQALAGGTA
jgi:2-C-methyl-D-erythritol 2,4-cyclodiphosphate synthase